MFNRENYYPSKSTNDNIQNRRRPESRPVHLHPPPLSSENSQSPDNQSGGVEE